MTIFKMKHAPEKFILNSVLLSLVIIGVIACSKISDAERMKNAATYMTEGSYRAAVIELKNAIQANTKNKNSRFLLGQAYLKLGEGSNAENELRRAGELGIARSEIIAPLGNAFILQGKYKKALKIFHSGGAKKNKDRLQILLLSGESYLGLSDYKNAEKAYVAAQKIAPEHPEPLLGRAKIAMKQGRLVQAGIYLEKAKQFAPDNIERILLSAELYALKGEQTKAEAGFKRALKLNKVKDFTRQKFQALTGMVTSQILQKKLGVASRSIALLIKARPGHPLVKYLQAWLAFQKKNYALANTVLLDLQRKAPKYLPGLLLLGATNYALGNYEQANIYLLRFVNKVPTHSYARKLLAATQLKLNQPKKAMRTLHSGIKTTDAGLLEMMGQVAALTGNTSGHVSYLKEAIKEDPANLLLRKELAKTYIRQGDLKDAITELQLLHKKNLRDRSTDVLLIFAHLRAGQVNSAINLAKKILRNKPSDPDLQAVMGEVDLVAGKRDMARQRFHKALKLQKNHSYSQLSLARMDLDDGNLIGADKWFNKVLSENKASIPALLGRAQIAARQGNMDKALSFLEKARTADARAVLPRIILTRYYLATGKADLALKLANEVNRLQPDSATSLLLLGRAWLLGKQPQNAADAYQKLVRKQPSATAYFELAVAQRALGNLVSARTSLKKSLQQDAKYLKAKVMLVDLDLTSNQYAQALKLANEIKRQYRDKAIGYRLKGDIYMQEKRYKKAQSAFQMAIKREPGANLAIKLSRACFLAGDTAKGLVILNKGIARYPDHIGLRLALAIHYQFAGNAVLAEQNYRKLLERKPSNIIALNNMASLLTDRNPEKALSYARQAYQLAPKSMAVTDTLGWLLLNQKQIKEGLEVLTEAVSRGNNPTVKYHLAVALVKNGKKEKARTILGGLLKSGIKFPEQTEASKLLAGLRQ